MGTWADSMSSLLWTVLWWTYGGMYLFGGMTSSPLDILLMAFAFSLPRYSLSTCHLASASTSHWNLFQRPYTDTPFFTPFIHLATVAPILLSLSLPFLGSSSWSSKCRDACSSYAYLWPPCLLLSPFLKVFHVSRLVCNSCIFSYYVFFTFKILCAPQTQQVLTELVIFAAISCQPPLWPTVCFKDGSGNYSHPTCSSAMWPCHPHWQWESNPLLLNLGWLLGLLSPTVCGRSGTVQLLRLGWKGLYSFLLVPLEGSPLQKLASRKDHTAFSWFYWKTPCYRSLPLSNPAAVPMAAQCTGEARMCFSQQLQMSPAFQ